MRFNPMMLMGNSPIAQILGALQNGGNPNAMIQQVIENHPQRAQIMQIVGGKSPDQLMKVAENMCRERGVTMDDVLKQFGITR